jgi:hypothetical protein
MEEALRERFLTALDTALANADPENVQSEDHGGFVNRWTGARSGRYVIDFSRADRGDGPRTGWFRVRRLADGYEASLTALNSGHLDYHSKLADEIPDLAAFVAETERFAARLDASPAVR